MAEAKAVLTTCKDGAAQGEACCGYGKGEKCR